MTMLALAVSQHYSDGKLLIIILFMHILSAYPSRICLAKVKKASSTFVDVLADVSKKGIEC